MLAMLASNFTLVEAFWCNNSYLYCFNCYQQ